MSELSKLQSALKQALSSSSTTKSMTLEEFQEYAASQLKALAFDSPDTAKKRIEALSSVTQKVRTHKFDEHDRVEFESFDSDTSTSKEFDPPKEKDGTAVQPAGDPPPLADSPTSKSLSEVVQDLQALLGTGEAEQGKQFGSGGGGGGGGSSDDEEEDDEAARRRRQEQMRQKNEDSGEAGGKEEQSNADAMAAAVEEGYEPVDPSDPNQVFPLDMNENRYDENGNLVRKRMPWGRDSYGAA